MNDSNDRGLRDYIASIEIVGIEGMSYGRQEAARHSLYAVMTVALHKTGMERNQDYQFLKVEYGAVLVLNECPEATRIAQIGVGVIQAAVSANLTLRIGLHCGHTTKYPAQGLEADLPGSGFHWASHVRRLARPGEVFVSSMLGAELHAFEDWKRRLIFTGLHDTPNGQQERAYVLFWNASSQALSRP